MGIRVGVSGQEVEGAGKGLFIYWRQRRSSGGQVTAVFEARELTVRIGSKRVREKVLVRKSRRGLAEELKGSDSDIPQLQKNHQPDGARRA